MATGGSCTYSGHDMKTTHAGMKIPNGGFGVLVENLVKALDLFKVLAQEKGELLGFLEPMKKILSKLCKDHEAIEAGRSVPTRFYTEEASWCDGW
jgi:hypothetical protein